MCHGCFVLIGYASSWRGSGCTGKPSPLWKRTLIPTDIWAPEDVRLSKKGAPQERPFE
jgi:hypothetical protein